MKCVLVCPSLRHAVGHLSDPAPLVTIPVYGETLIGCWLDHLASSGCKEVVVSVTDRPDDVREVVGRGERWGIKVEVCAELRELTLDQAMEKHFPEAPHTEKRGFIIDRFPGAGTGDLFASYSAWFHRLIEWMPEAARSARIGLREASPGVWLGFRAQVSPAAKLYGPCWIGENVRIGPDAVVGPNTVIENQAVIESACELQNSWVGPETFVGSLTRVENSLAWGNTLINWKTNSATVVPDAFLLSSLSQKNGGSAFSERLASIFQNSFTRPLGLLSALRQRARR